MFRGGETRDGSKKMSTSVLRTGQTLPPKVGGLHLDSVLGIIFIEGVLDREEVHKKICIKVRKQRRAGGIHGCILYGVSLAATRPRSNGGSLSFMICTSTGLLGTSPHFSTGKKQIVGCGHST